MKQISQATIVPIFLMLVLLISHTCARSLPSNPGTKPKKMTLLLQEDDFSNLMGLEKCSDIEDEECEKRRMVAEAHLDYIYTQHHHHP